MSTILAIETSCDETALALVKCDKPSNISLIDSVIASQITLHASYGGVVPNLAAREHMKSIIPLLKHILKKNAISQENIDAIAVTYTPGLIPALLVGTMTAKTLSWLWKKPLLGIHHLEGHIYANVLETDNGKWITEKRKNTSMPFIFPLLALVVSGGHTQLIVMKKHFDYKIVGETQDDAVGEAFDKVARILGLGYPGGPEISQRAELYTKSQTPDSKLQIPNLPRPMLHSGNLNFSFSGLKTAVLYAVKKYRQENNLKETDPLSADFVNAMSYAFQEASVDVLIHKTRKAIKKYAIKKVVLAGGVGANIHLQNEIQQMLKKDFPDIEYSHPPAHCITDNAAMIGASGLMRWNAMSDEEKEKRKNTWKTLEAKAESNISTS
jgi:N6-L-threonylcarbamoyladenine synthase